MASTTQVTHDHRREKFEALLALLLALHLSTHNGPEAEISAGSPMVRLVLAQFLLLGLKATFGGEKELHRVSIGVLSCFMSLLARRRWMLLLWLWLLLMV